MRNFLAAIAALMSIFFALPAQAQDTIPAEDETFYRVTGHSWTTGEFSSMDPTDWSRTSHEGGVVVKAVFDITLDDPHMRTGIGENGFFLNWYGSGENHAPNGFFDIFGSGTNLLDGGRASGSITSGFYGHNYTGSGWNSAPMTFIVEKLSGDPWEGPHERWGLRSFSVSAVPESATWAMMIIGFGGVGVAMRRRRKDELQVTYA